MKTAQFWNTLATGFPKELPSGITVTVKMFPLEQYLQLGRIPNELQQIALDVFFKGGIQNIEDRLEETVKFADYIVSKCLVEPVAQLDRKKVGEGEVYIKDIPWSDRQAIYLAAIRPDHIHLDFLSKTTDSSGGSTPLPNATGNVPQAS